MKKRILLADDHPLVRKGVRQILDGQYEICGEAADGAEAVKKAAELEPDLVIMDINMPVMDGIDASRLIRQMLPETKILALSMHNSAHMEQDVTAAGANAMLTKASRPNEIVAAIEKLLDGRLVGNAN